MHIYQSTQNFTDLELETSDAFKKGDTLLLLLGIQRSSYMVVPTINRFTIEDIKSSGQTSLLKSEKLRRDIIEYYSRLKRYEEWW